MSVGFLPLGEIRNALVNLLDEEPTRTLFFRYPELRDFFQYFHNTWFLTFPQKCGTFSKDLPECAQQLFAKDGIVPGTVQPVVGGPIFRWRSDSWQERVIKNTVNRMQAGEMPPRQRQKWRTLNSQTEALKISLTSGNRSLMNYWKAVSYVCISMEMVFQ